MARRFTVEEALAAIMDGSSTEESDASELDELVEDPAAEDSDDYLIVQQLVEEIGPTSTRSNNDIQKWSRNVDEAAC